MQFIEKADIFHICFFLDIADIFHICFFLDIPKVQKEPSLWFPILFIWKEICVGRKNLDFSALL